MTLSDPLAMATNLTRPKRLLAAGFIRVHLLLLPATARHNSEYRNPFQIVNGTDSFPEIVVACRDASQIKPHGFPIIAKQIQVLRRLSCASTLVTTLLATRDWPPSSIKIVRSSNGAVPATAASR